MKRFILVAVLLAVFCLPSFAQFQTVETEPNNSFSTASPLPQNESILGTLGGGDVIDYHGLDFQYNANLYLEFNFTNSGNNGTKLVNIRVYNTLRMNDEYVGQIYNTGLQLDEGESADFTVDLLGLARDSFYVVIDSDADFQYSLNWHAGNSFTIDDQFFQQNNTPASALPFTYNVQQGGSLAYEFWGNIDFDTVDCFKTTLPAGTYTNTVLKISAQNNYSGPPAWMKYLLYKNGSSTPFATGYVGDIQSTTAYQSIRSTIPIPGLVAGDQILVKLVSNGTFGYDFTLREVDIYDDDEDNCCVYNAIPIAAGQTKSGNVGDYDQYEGQYIDEYDTYEFIMPYSGSIKIHVTGSNTDCSNDYYSLEAAIMDKFGNEKRYETLLWWDSYPDCNTVMTDSIKIRGIAKDTFYLRLYTGNSFGKINYSIRYETLDSTTNMDVEPNNTFATALPIAPGQLRKGSVQFVQAGNYDNVDFYKGTMPADGNIRIFLKTIFRGPNMNNDISLVTNNTFTHRARPRNGDNGLVPDSVYVDTFDICGVRQGDLSFEFRTTFNNPPYEYEFSYIITETATDTDIEPNNSFAQAKRVGANSTQKGIIAYTGQTSSLNDTYDFYKMVFTTTDSLKLYFQATNVNCYYSAGSNRNMSVRGYNKNQTQIFAKTIGSSNVAPGQTVTDSVKIRVVATDTIYVRIEANTSFKYQFTTNNRLPYSGFFIEGDTAVCTGTQTYRAVNLADEPVTYTWSLPDGGGILNFTDSLATVEWNATGNRRIQLQISNAAGNITKSRTVIINGIAPTEVPVAYNFARTLSTNSFPAGTTAQWYKNGFEIPGATNPSYYAADAGSYTVRFASDCGAGPASNAIVFNDPALPQTINFPHAADVIMSPTAFVKLTATSSSGLPVYYQKISGQGYIQNDTLFITGNNAVGNVVVKAMQPGDDVYSPAPEVTDTIKVLKGNQTITFGPIPDQILNSTDLMLEGTTSSGLTIVYTVIQGTNIASVNDLSGSQSSVNKLGAGTVTLRAAQNGNANYNAATPVEQSFCIGIRTLTPITGDPNPCLATYRYNTQRITGAIYEWTLSGGGVLTTHNDTAWVQWQTPGTHTLKVKAKSPCDPVYTNEQEFVVTTSANNPAPVTNMIPANNAVDQQLPLVLSWVPGTNTVNYDLYLWDAELPEPATPWAANINAVNFTLPRNAPLPYNRDYKWRIVSKNPCTQTAGPVQQFRLIPLPDLQVSNVQAPATANSGSTITISWQVTNVGPGNTLPNATWYDGVYFALDTVPNVNFNSSPNWDVDNWNSLTANGRPLLLGKKIRPTSLVSGQSYTNSIDFTLPMNYSFPVYIYVITDNEHPNWKILQVSVLNDTARKQQPMNIQLTPTPDLRVDSVFAPFSAFSGSTVNLSYKVKNFGALTPPGASWIDSVFISQSPLFDRNNAIPVNSPKSNDSYYPNALRAAGYTNTQLQQDSSYYRNMNVVIPNFIFGTWFIYVKANASVTQPNIYEGPLNDNNINRAQIEVYLTPTPKLMVSSLNLPASSASTTQKVGINWNIKNEGSRDNIERNRGHYFTIGSCAVPCGPGAPHNAVCMTSDIAGDSVVFGSSYWIDRVYLSTNPNSLDVNSAILVSELAHGVKNSGLYLDELYRVAGCNPYGGGATLNVHNVIKPGSDFPRDTNFTVPANLPAGTYYVYVYTNPTREVFEYPGTPQIKRSATPIVIHRPDVSAQGLVVPPNAAGGQTVTVNYNVVNTGTGSVFNHIRRDQLYVSTFSSFDVSAQLVATNTFTEDVPAGGTVSHDFTYTFPAATTGNRYFYVRTNYDSSFKETSYVNNTSASAVTLVSAAVPADMVVTGSLLPDSVFAIYNNNIQYTVKNNGSGATIGAWVDSLFVSCNPVFNPATSYYLGRKSQTRILGPGESFTDTFNFRTSVMSYELNGCFPVNSSAPAYFFVKTNANNGAYEGPNINNNVGAPLNKTFVNPLVDHIVPVVTGATSTSVGSPFTVNWSLKNIGYNPGLTRYYYDYYDRIGFAADSVAGPNDHIAAVLLKYNVLNRNQELPFAKTFHTPNMPTGDYYVYVRNNYNNGIAAEKNLSNNVNFIRDNTGAATKVHVIQPALSDLVDSIISAPASVAKGQPITVIYKVTNKGTGTTFPGNNFRNELLLSKDFSAANNGGDRLLGSSNRVTPLAPNEFYYDTVTVTIPSFTDAGNYVLISEANAGKTIIEMNMDNNLGFSLLNVYDPPVTDLIVDKVSAPDTVTLGYNMDTVKWVVKNVSGEQARGYSKDGIYIASGDIFDSTSVLLGILNKNILMQPLDSDTLEMSPLVTGVTEGNYNVFVKTDVLNNIIESDKENNVGMTITPVYVKVNELLLDIDEPNTLQNVSRFYKLRIPDSLVGATIMVTLKTPDSLTMRNEMYISGGRIPTAAQYDYRFELPNSGNQRIVISDVTDSIYYIMYRCVSPNPIVQNVKLKAVRLPFAILDVHTNSGANIGNVTIRISGSLFSDSMVAKLTRGGTTIYSSKVYYTNSAQVFATFNLQGRPLGIYDVTLVKPDMTEAVLPQGFSVVVANNGGLITGGGNNTGAGNGNEPGCDPGAASGLNSQLVVDLIVPQRVLQDRPVVIAINYSNPTNFDLPAQSKILYSEYDVKMAFTKEGVPNGTTSLYLEFTEPGGPPGIIRAGASGTILIHTRAPKVSPPPGFVIFKLK